MSETIVNIFVGNTHSKLANLGVIDTHNLILFGSTKTKTGDEVHEEQNDTCSEEGIDKSSDRVGKLISKLDVVLVDPTTVDLGGTVKVGYVITANPRLASSDS